MSGYIYKVTEFTALDPDEWQHRLFTTRKYEATQFLKRELMAGKPLSKYEVTRSRDGRADSTVEVDVYEFMQIDLGEE